MTHTLAPAVDSSRDWTKVNSSFAIVWMSMTFLYDIVIAATIIQRGRLVMPWQYSMNLSLGSTSILNSQSARRLYELWASMCARDPRREISQEGEYDKLKKKVNWRAKRGELKCLESKLRRWIDWFFSPDLDIDDRRDPLFSLSLLGQRKMCQTHAAHICVRKSMKLARNLWKSCLIYWTTRQLASLLHLSRGFTVRTENPLFVRTYSIWTQREQLETLEMA